MTCNSQPYRSTDKCATAAATAVVATAAAAASAAGGAAAGASASAAAGASASAAAHAAEARALNTHTARSRIQPRHTGTSGATQQDVSQEHTNTRLHREGMLLGVTTGSSSHLPLSQCYGPSVAA